MKTLSVAIFAGLMGLICAESQPARLYQGPHANIDQCASAPQDRKQCGTRTYDQLECRSRGCCFKEIPGRPEVPACYLALRMLTDECMVEYEEKEDCGYYGITEGECMNRECCWQPSFTGLPNDPWCFNKKAAPPAAAEIRLVGGSDSSEGRVELIHDGQWGTICDDGWDNHDADVVCTQLGYASGRAYRSAYFGAGVGQIWLDDVECTGDEEAVWDCENYGWGNHNCDHSEDASVKCSNEEGSADQDYYY